MNKLYLSIRSTDHGKDLCKFEVAEVPNNLKKFDFLSIDLKIDTIYSIKMVIVYTFSRKNILIYFEYF